VEGITHMPICAAASVLAVVLTQSGWALARAQPREVGRTYWELIPETELWVRLVPEDPEGKPPLVNLVFHAFFPGRAKRDPYSGFPQWPKGYPSRLTLSAEPLPQTLIRELALRLVIDDKTIDLTGPGGRYRNLPCLVATESCTPNAVEAELDASVLRSVATARSVLGVALGFPVRLVAADQHAVREFAAKLNSGRQRMAANETVGPAGMSWSEQCRPTRVKLTWPETLSFVDAFRVRWTIGGAMRSARLGMAVALVLVTGELEAAPRKSPQADVGPGRIAWFDITASDLAKSKEFYGKLFGWEFTPLEGTDQAVEIVAGVTAIGTLRVADGKISAFNGVVYVQVTEIRASCSKASELGGTIAPGGHPLVRTQSDGEPGGVKSRRRKRNFSARLG
jgi:predicted enzyme related to lactoylglutathione lyase